MRIDGSFKKHVSYLNTTQLNESKDVVYIIDAEFKIRAFNAAWIRFAQENSGGDIQKRYSFGFPIFEVCAEPIKGYIVHAYRRALSENTPFLMKYECSSAEKMRVYQQTAYPLLESRGLMISNHLVVEKKHSEEEAVFNAGFEDENGIITQCMNCRKIRDPQNRNVWLWVPSLLESPLENISHSICLQCCEHYWPDLDLQQSLI